MIRLLGDCPTCGQPHSHGRRCRSCQDRRPTPEARDDDPPWSPPGGSYRNVTWTPNWNPLR